MNHQDYMRLALELAERGAGWTNPNPLGGAVIVKDGTIIGQGYHQRYGQAHAERNALQSCTQDPWGATLYVTLEPCCHQGKQPPCTQAILDAGIAKVVVGSHDPNPLVAGKGLEILRRHGIEVETGVCQEACDALNQVFFHYIRTRRPGPPGGSPGRRPGPRCTGTGTDTPPFWWGWARCWPTTPCSPAAWRGAEIPCASSATPTCAPPWTASWCAPPPKCPPWLPPAPPTPPVSSRWRMPGARCGPCRSEKATWTSPPSWSGWGPKG